MIDEILADAEQHMQKTVDSLKRELGSLRTGRASPGLIERLQVDYYGAATPLLQLASISTPEPRMLSIQPYDRSAFAAIEKAIQKSDLGLTPSNDGRVIRIAFPPLTQERRKDMVKMVKKMVEEHKVGLRNHRRDAIDMLRDLEKSKDISEDDNKRAQEKLQKLIDKGNVEVEKVGMVKEAEVMEV